MSSRSTTAHHSTTRSSSQTTMKPSRNAASIETSVTKLLMSTKHLLQSLTQWSKGQANERDVSDAYVQLGNDFKLLTKQFAHAGLEVSDLGDVPSSLRKVLEVALRERPSEGTLDKYLPTIREIVVNLLDKLKVKQTLMKGMKHNEQHISTRNSRSGSSVSGNSGHSTPRHQGAGRSVPSSASSSPHRSPDATSTPNKPESQSSVNITKPREEPNGALAQLKKSDTLQRRASKRFSAYHIAKLTHQSTSEAAAMSTPPNLGDKSSNKTSFDAPLPRGEKEEKTKQLPGSAVREPQALEGQDITVFLQLGGKTKKCSLSLPASFTSLRLLFVEKFTYTPGANTFPEIYIKDPNHEISYELEGSHLDSIKDGSLITLRIESSDTNLGDAALKQILQGFEQKIIEQHESLIKEMRGLNHTVSSSPKQAAENRVSVSRATSGSEIDDIKHQLAVLNQIHSAKQKSLDSNISHILESIAKFKSLSFNSSTTANRIYMEKSHMKLSEVSDELLSKVDDLQDVIEALRKDVAVRGSRPSKKKLETVNLELSEAQAGLEKMQDYISIEKPNWKKIWESELEKVCEEQQFLTLQEDLALDFKEDLEKVRETFDLVKMCCEEKNKNQKKNNNPILPIAKPGTFNQIRKAVLTQVESLHPDHEERLEAIEKAERLRLREKGYRDNSEFEDELGSFVVNKNFKKAGGIDEIERLRRQKDEENIRATFKPPLL